MMDVPSNQQWCHQITGETLQELIANVEAWLLANSGSFLLRGIDYYHNDRPHGLKNTPENMALIYYTNRLTK